MRQVLLYLAVLLAAGNSQAAAQATVRVEPGDPQSLQQQLLSLAQRQLAGVGLSLDPKRVWMSLSRQPDAGVFEVRPAWPPNAQPPALPLVFELIPSADGAAAQLGGERAIQATLAVTLLKDVWVASRRLRKGSQVRCEDLRQESRRLRELPRTPLPAACDIAAGTIALRDLAAGDVIRGSDIGAAPDVMAGAPVRISAATKGISVTTSAIALADAKVGDQIEVRLRNPTRTLKTRVTGPGSVQAIGGSP